MFTILRGPAEQGVDRMGSGLIDMIVSHLSSKRSLTLSAAILLLPQRRHKVIEKFRAAARDFSILIPPIQVAVYCGKANAVIEEPCPRKWSLARIAHSKDASALANEKLLYESVIPTPVSFTFIRSISLSYRGVADNFELIKEPIRNA